MTIGSTIALIGGLAIALAILAYLADSLGRGGDQ